MYRGYTSCPERAEDFHLFWNRNAFGYNLFAWNCQAYVKFKLFQFFQITFFFLFLYAESAVGMYSNYGIKLTSTIRLLF